MTEILVIAPAWVGDMVMAQALFRQLKADQPGTNIHVVGPPWILPLIERMPEISSGSKLDVAHGALGLAARHRLARGLKEKKFDLAITLPNSFKAALVPWLAGIPRRRGYRGEMRYRLINEMHRLDKTKLPRTVERFAALARKTAPDIAPAILPPRLETNKDEAGTLAAGLGLGLDSPVVGLCPGAEYGPAKQWPLAYYGDLARRLAETGKGVWIFGSPRDREAGETIVRTADHEGVHNLCGQTSLTQAIDLMSLCTAVVSNDSGLMHVAAALDIPLVALFGSSTPDMTPPLSEKAAILARDLECRPCFKRECPLGHLDCLTGIPVDRVMAALPQT